MSAVANGSRPVVVLVVEDEWLMRQCIADYLHESGCTVIEAEDGDHAIHICNSGTPVDVLFTDINLNGSADGWMVAEIFRSARDNIPVIYASGNPIDRVRCVPGSVRFEKPYRPEDILSACVRLKDAAETRDLL
jgi:CheY-like chemotaxis protein